MYSLKHEIGSLDGGANPPASTNKIQGGRFRFDRRLKACGESVRKLPWTQQKL